MMHKDRCKKAFKNKSDNNLFIKEGAKQRTCNCLK